MKKAALNSIGRLHAELGPILKAIVLSNCQDSMRDQVEKAMESHPHDPSYASSEWPKASIASQTTSRGKSVSSDVGDNDDSNGLALEIPRMDLLASLSADCITKMVSSLVVAFGARAIRF